MGIVLPRRARVPAALAVAAALALGAAGCGDDDGGSDNAGATTDGAQSERDRVVAFVQRTGALFEKGDAAGVCAAMTTATRQRQAAQAKGLAAYLGKSSDAPATCETAMDATFSGDVIEDFQPRIVAVKITGDRARVTGDVSHDTDDQVAILARQGGDWKVVRWFAHPEQEGSAAAQPSGS